MLRWFALVGTFLILCQTTASAQGVDPDLVKASLGRKAILERSDGASYQGTVRRVTATAVIIERSDGQLLKIPLSYIVRVRIVKAVQPPPVVTPPPAYGGGGPYGRYGVQGGYVQPNLVGNALKLQQTKEHYWSAVRLRNAGMALFITGTILTVIGGGLFAVPSDCYDSYYDSYCDDNYGAIIAGITLCTIGGLLDMIGIPLWIVGSVKSKVYWEQLKKLNAGQAVSDDGMPRRSPFPVVAGNSSPSRAFKLNYTFRF
ncbi:MAG: hypothetical protein ABI333_21975 [bacterium]